MRAAKDGWITMDHAELMAASHGRAPMNTDEQLDLLAIGVQQGPDVFKATLAKYEVKRLADAGLNPTEQQHCTSCGIRASSCDVHHIVPWEHGGTTDIDNLTLLCPTCHRHTHKHP